MSDSTAARDARGPSSQPSAAADAGDFRRPALARHTFRGFLGQAEQKLVLFADELVVRRGRERALRVPLARVREINLRLY